MHAESDAITTGLAERARAEGRATMRDYLDSRPAIAELEAVGRAIALAEETGCSLHVVHVSTAASAVLVAEARARGVDVTCETCPHYLVLTDEDAERIGALAKCSPPIRPRAEVEALWAEVLAGAIPMIASDHSPAPPELKQGDDAFAMVGRHLGRADAARHAARRVSHRGAVSRRGDIAQLIAGAAADRFSLHSKGWLEVGRDADLALVDLDHESVVTNADLLYRHPQGPFVGRPVRGRVVRTLLRGTTVIDDGRLVHRCTLLAASCVRR